MRKIIVGAWRDDANGPMQVVSGPLGRDKVHSEAPAAPLRENEMAHFLAWANEHDDKLERTQKGTLDITPWLQWFLACLGRAFDGTETTLAAVKDYARTMKKLS